MIASWYFGTIRRHKRRLFWFSIDLLAEYHLQTTVLVVAIHFTIILMKRHLAMIYGKVLTRELSRSINQPVKGNRRLKHQYINQRTGLDSCPLFYCVVKYANVRVMSRIKIFVISPPLCFSLTGESLQIYKYIIEINYFYLIIQGILDIICFD